MRKQAVPRGIGAFFILIIFFCQPFSIRAQSYEASPEPYTAEAAGDYEAYKPEEFPQWARSLRRWETIFFGSLPFAFLFTGLGFDLYKYADSSFDANYLPLFFGASPEKEAFVRDTVTQRILVSVSLSALIGTVDFFLDRRADE